MSKPFRPGPRKEPSRSSRPAWLRERAGTRHRIHLGQGRSLPFLIGTVSGPTGAAGGLGKIPMPVRLFSMPINLAFGSSALMAALTATGRLPRHLSTGGASWHGPLPLRAFVPAGSQVGPRLTMKSKPVAMRKRFATCLVGLAFVALPSSFFLTPNGKPALPLFTG